MTGEAKRKLNVLHIEDSEDDSLLVECALKGGKYNTIITRVETEESMRTAIDSVCWDVILCDYNMPRFSGPEALEIYKSREGLNSTPFILVADISQTEADAMLSNGAWAYVSKSSLEGLVPAVQKALETSQ